MEVDRIIRSMEWLVQDAKFRFDQQYNPGNYSPELKEAIEVLERLKRDYSHGTVSPSYKTHDMMVIS